MTVKDPLSHAEKKHALEEFYGGEVPDSTVTRVIVRDAIVEREQ